MDRSTLASAIDHTVLGPTTTPADVEHTLETAAEYGMNVCIPPCYLSLEATTSFDGTVVTVVGFPHGQHAPAVKRTEAVRAWRAGADELDVVMNVGRLRAGDEPSVESELAEVIAAVPIPVKVIVQSPMLDTSAMHQAGSIAAGVDAAMLKTATGFSPGGATVEAVSLLSAYGPVKASGGIETYEDARALLEAGATRIGTSSGQAILSGAPDQSPSN